VNEIQEIIDKYIYEQEKFSMVQDEYNKLKSEWHKALKSVPDDVKDLFDGMKKGDINEMIENEPEKYSQLVKKLDHSSEYVKSRELQKEYSDFKYKYFIEAIHFFEFIIEERKRNISDVYITWLDNLATEGWFMYYVVAEELQLNGELGRDCIFLEKFWSWFDFKNLRFLTKELVSLTNDLNVLRREKSRDFREALDSIYQGNYRTAARTMLALLENEHKNCGNSSKKTRGLKRSKNINKLISSMKLDYFENLWQKYDSYYKKLNSPTKIDNVLNRNELIHGEYDADVSMVDVLKLVFLYISFKELSYNVQLRIEFYEEFIEDLKAQHIYNNYLKKKK